MKGDFTRSTFDRAKHYRSVRMQQGRVQLDADWNEEMDIAGHRIETETLDLIGPSGGPMHHDGFHIVTALSMLSADENSRPENQNVPALLPGDFYISGGRYYVDGILCENEHIVLFSAQPDLPNAKRLGSGGLPLIGHPELPTAEKATAKKGKSIGFQPSLLDPDPLRSSGVYIAYLDVWSRHVTALDDPLIREVALGGPDTATRLKTIAQVKLLRVGNAGANINCLTGAAPWDVLIAPTNARLQARTEPDTVSNDPCIVEPGAGYRRLENQLYRVEIDKPGPVGTATFKWSRDDGSIVTSWLSKKGDELTVGSIGRDAVMRFAGGQWVELSDDTCELNGKPGTLVQLKKAEGQVLTIVPATATGSVAQTSFPRNPKVRRWDGIGVVSIPGGSTGGYLPIEDGVQIRFQSGATYKTGDYWLIPARTATGDIEWPRDSANSPLSLPPHGIQHHYCRLALLDFNGTAFTKTIDCRSLFPAVTELTSFFYLSGDGQEATPDPSQPAALLPVTELRVGVANGEFPVLGARVEFKILAGNGHLHGAASPAIVFTTADGVAACPWELDSATQKQQVEARLTDALGQTVHLPVRFNANLSRATEVSYDPRNCANLASAKTVQDAIDILCKVDQGKSCCVAVGKGGEFEKLDDAISKLLQTETDICICLMPGDHHLASGLAINSVPNKPTHVRVTGCGRASRLSVSAKMFEVSKLASFALSDLSVLAVDKPALNPITIENCAEVSITGCYLRQQQLDITDLLTIAGASRIVLANNFIESYWWQEPLRKFFGVTSAAEFSTSSFDAMILNAAMKLARGGAKAQTDLVKTVGRSSPQKRARVSRTSTVSEILSQIKEVKIQRQNMSDAVAQLSFLLPQLVIAPAVVIADANADVSIHNNIIVGQVRFYGRQNMLGQSQFDEIAKRIQLRRLTLGSTQRGAKIEGNTLTEVTVDSRIGAADTTLDGVFNRISLLDNTFSSPRNEWLAANVISNGNYFNLNLPGETKLGTVAASSFICLGTSAGNRGNQLRYAVPTVTGVQPAFEKSANLLDVLPI